MFLGHCIKLLTFNEFDSWREDLKTLLSVPDKGICIHLRMLFFTRESTFSIIQVLGIVAAVKCRNRLDKT